MTVGVQRVAQPSNDIGAIVQNALTYWEERSESLAGYPVAYDYDPDASAPDISVKTMADIESCSGTTDENLLGCAPVIKQNPPETAVIELVVGYRQEWVTAMLKHELGHTLGLEHSSSADIMSPRLRGVSDSYQHRLDIVNQYDASFDSYNPATRAWENANNAWDAREYRRAKTLYASAQDAYQEALNAIDAALAMIDPQVDTEAHRIVSQSHSYVEQYVRAASAAVDMVNAAMNNNDPQPYRQDVLTHIDRSEIFTYHGTAALEDAFGFPPD